ncbi:surface-adhesin E family protein [Sphingomonas sp. SRS2]|uniref:surface-adhesin E family protein n=1 Tax=Sphingomonas sp. SRS2 TaxID=133190 RepID=UPI000A7D4AC1|nr:surface-adhesin E family protein [Sphingomonas sp. SRS2]
MFPQAHIRFGAMIGIAAAFACPASAKEAQVTGMALQQIQAKDFEAPVSIVFPAVMTILQDAGFRIQSADRDTGLITAIGPSKAYLTWLPFIGFGQGKKIPIVSAFIEQRGADLTRARLNFVMSSGKSQLAFTDENPVLDPPVYREAFERIEKEIFVRQAMAAPLPPTPPPPPPRAPVLPLASQLTVAATELLPRQWHQASYSPDVSVAFIDAANSTRVGEVVRFWLSIYYRPDQGSDHFIASREANCSTQAFRDLSTTHYMGKASVGSSKVATAYSQAKPNTVNDEIIRTACGIQPLGKPFKDTDAAAQLYFENANW